MHFAERESLRPSIEATYAQGATRAEVLAQYPQAVAAEPQAQAQEGPDGMPGRPLTVAEQVHIRKLLHGIGEADPRTVEEVVRRCQDSPGYRRYFLARASQEHTAALGEAHADHQSVSNAPKPAPLRHHPDGAAKTFTNPIPREAGNA